MGVRTSLTLRLVDAHSAARGDQWLDRDLRQHRLVWALERNISTPESRSAHQALVGDDGVGHHTGDCSIIPYSVLFQFAVIA